MTWLITEPDDDADVHDAEVVDGPMIAGAR